jgi:hypothetical protein
MGFCIGSAQISLCMAAICVTFDHMVKQMEASGGSPNE